MAEASSTEDVITLRIRFKSETLEKFAERYAVDLGPQEVFVRTREPLPVGTALNFDFTLQDGSPLLAGRGTVTWAREPDVARTEPAGMGIRFDNLTPHSREVLSKILERKPRQPIKAGQSSTDRHRALTPKAGVPTSPVPAPMSMAATPRSPVPVGAKRVEFPSDPVDEDQERTEIARMPPSFYYENAQGEEETRARDGLPDAGLLDDLDDITSPRAEMPLPATSPGPRLNAAPDAGRREPLPSASRGPSRPEPPISWRPSATAPVPGSLASALRGPMQTGSTPNRGSPAAREPGSPLGMGARSPAPEPLPGRTPAPGPRIPTPMPRENSGRAFGRVDAPTPRPEPPSFVPPPHPSAPPEGLDMPTPAWPMLGMQPPPTGTTSEVEEAGLLSEDLIPDEPRRSGTGKTWVAMGLLAVAAVVGGLWAVPKLMKPGPEVASAPPPVPAEPVPTTETPGANPYAPPGTPPVAEATPPAAAAPGTPAAAPGTPAAAPGGTEPAVAAAEAPPSAAPAAAAPSPPVLAAPTRRKVRNVGPPRRSAESPDTVVAGDTPPTVASAQGSGPATAAEPGATAPSIPTPADPGEEVFWLYVRTTPAGADVLIDGQVEGKTPFQRRIFDPNRNYALTIRKAGFEPVERSMSATDQWVKKGNQRTYTVTAKLAPAPAGQSPSTETAADPAPPTAAPPAPVPAPKANPFDEPGAGAQP